jgi:hypothetical protein
MQKFVRTDPARKYILFANSDNNLNALHVYINNNANVIEIHRAGPELLRLDTETMVKIMGTICNFPS